MDPELVTATVVTNPRWARILVWTFLTLGGAAGGWLLKSMIGWLPKLYWIPYPDLIQTAVLLVEPYATIAALALGAAAGLRVAYRQSKREVRVAVTTKAAIFQLGRRPGRRFAREGVTAVFLDPNQLVLLAGEIERTRQFCDLEEDKLRCAFQRHGWPWLDGGDPFADRYRLWTVDDADLPPAAHDLLQARVRAWSRKDILEAERLWVALGRLGINVRDTLDGQQWRSFNPL